MAMNGNFVSDFINEEDFDAILRGTYPTVFNRGWELRYFTIPENDSAYQKELNLKISTCYLK